ncbi:MAG: rhomboid family intramembrane serine protease [Candidatus Azobacteroides sp.]|nr:rhomboid family intramembrane serine protease [Candidatus Azobacteroides sp.]
MAGIISNIEHFFKQKSILSYLIIINLFVFFLLKILEGICRLCDLDSIDPLAIFAVPASFDRLFLHPWTLLTYMFTHLGFWHILFNLLWLYWFGQLFVQFFSPRQLGGLYLLGGFAGGLLFVLSYNLFPHLLKVNDTAYLIGASASVMAIVFATAFFNKDFEINVLFLGNIKLIYIALFLLLLDFISIRENSGGHIAHIGGALMGYGFAKSYRKGKDLTAWINAAIDWIVNFFTQKRKKKRIKMVYKRPETDYEYNKRRSEQQAEIDRILDKIKKSGYNSLSDNEKKTLFNANK